MNVVLIGMRGSGKTTVGEMLAEKLGRKFVDMDGLIARRAGMSIPRIVEQHGWGRFRELEEEIAAEVAGLQAVVIGAGGGVVTQDRAVRKLRRGGIMVWLTADVETILERIGEDSGRPLLVGGRTWREDIALTLEERKPLYGAAADFTMATAGRTAEEVVAGIIMLLKTKGI